ncbi:84755455-ab05-4b84-aba7-01394a00b53e [Sclerotinia trifoliorum]|uniref:84755455-ab05-4b84-aba7-01394a00b53e n=1 Tax=Sclerotinia trifoliorum TaxID=28548 RepID=A0A8H2W0N1_9HELO|nr:84755455-ab05-4b84-aba7-01394a00b53e [Sclerotinia trifoliorum]
MSTYSLSLTAQEPQTQTHRVSIPGTPQPLSQPGTPNHRSSPPSTPSNRFSSPVEASSISDGLDIVPPRQRRFKSARLVGDYEKPWLEKFATDGKRKKLSGRTWDSIIFWTSIAIGFGLGGIMCYIGFTSVPKNLYCLMFEDDFHNIDPRIWSYEIQRGGFGTGSFEWTTNDPQNAYTDAEGLHIVPTLTVNSTNITPAQILNGYTLNLTTDNRADGVCTSDDAGTSCSMYSNITAGTIINPVRSARLSTKGKKTIKYGKIEVVAKMPKGDWLWPAIWMMPEDSVYGPWPASGEIDLAESKGNDGATYDGGRDSIISALHWGPIPQVDAFWKTDGKHNIRRTDYTESYYTYGLEWSEDYIFTYINSRLLQVFYLSFSKGYNSMWNRGEFGKTIVNNSALHDPWSQTGNPATPFDQAFYLILNVAVGGTNGYFPDKVGNKPWGDASLTAPAEFWNASSQWGPTWGPPEERGMTIKSVKMYSQGACGSAS